MAGFEPPRRSALRLLAAVAAGSLGGCSTFLPDGDGIQYGPPQYGNLRQSTVYVAEGAPVELPDGVDRTRTPERAELVVLPGDTGVEASTAVSWLRAGIGVALVGERAEATWRRYKDSEAYVYNFGPAGELELEADPRTIVVFVGEDSIVTHRYNVRDETPSNQAVLQALDDALAEAPDGDS